MNQQLSPIKRLLVASGRMYQTYISPYRPATCRFTPTCSNYFIEAVTHLPLPKALFYTLIRLLKCGPWHKGGYDPVPHT